MALRSAARTNKDQSADWSLFAHSAVRAVFSATYTPPPKISDQIVSCGGSFFAQWQQPQSDTKGFTSFTASLAQISTSPLSMSMSL